MNRLFLVFVTLLVLSGCASQTPENDVVVTPPSPTVDAGTHGTCLHKYTPALNFKYEGEPKSYQREMFGQTVWVHVFTRPNGENVFLSGDEILNFRCERQQRINTSIH